MAVPPAQFGHAHFHVSPGTTGMVVHMAGELDVATAPVLADILDVLQTPTTINVYLDASKLTFGDAAFVRTVLDARRCFARDGGWVQIVDPSRYVSRLLRLVCMDQLLHSRQPAQHDVRLGSHSGHGGELGRMGASVDASPRAHGALERASHSKTHRSSVDVSARRSLRSTLTETRGDGESMQPRTLVEEHSVSDVLDNLVQQA